MTYNEALQLINQFIVANGNNEITADVLRPILEAIVDASRDTTGLLQDLETEANEDLVAAINELKAMIPEGATGTPVNIHFGEANPNTTPPASFKPGDNYWQSVGGNPVQLWIYNGFSWVEFGSGGGGGGIPEAPIDGKAYGRKDESWTEVTNTPMNTAKVHYSDLGAASLEEVTPEMCDAWLEANYTEADRLGFLLEVTDEVPSFNFDVRADWAGNGITDEASFMFLLEDEYGLFSVSDFAIDGDRITANIAAVYPTDGIGFPNMGATEIHALNIPGVISCDMSENNISYVNVAGLSSDIISLVLYDNALTEESVNAILMKFDNDIADPSGREIYLNGGTSAAPTGAGLAAKNSLISKGAYVITN